MDTESLAFLNRAAESLAGAESEFATGRYNNCANRCYYAMFQAAIAALIAAGVRPAKAERPWEHDYVQAQFASILVRHRKLYSAKLAPMLVQVMNKRLAADYELAGVGRSAAEHVLEKARLFVGAIQERVI
jgi:uncharacterized protein (UPF0332 family)